MFISGDVTNSGSPAEYQAFVDEFVQPLAERLGEDGIILSVPGNHDVDRSRAKFVDSYTLRARSPRFFDPTPEGYAERENIVPRFQGFLDYDVTASGAWLKSSDGAFIHTRTVGGLSVGVLGVNTAWLSQSDADRNRLTPGFHIIEEGLEKLGDADIKLVLGHHPIDWFADDEQGPIQSLLTKHQAIYLHGHLHKNRSRMSVVGGQAYLALQGGAAFQAREDEQWVNGICWGKFEKADRAVEVRPLIWSREKREWSVDGNAFPNEYRSADFGIWRIPFPTGKTNVEVIEQAPKGLAAKAPKPIDASGWEAIDEEFLSTRRRPLEIEDLLGFFDGSVPKWAHAVSPSVPQREIVEEIVTSLSSAQQSDRSAVELVVGAGGEGKSTVILQVAARMAAVAGWKVIWRANETIKWSAELIANLDATGTVWLVVSDEADRIAAEVLHTLQRLTETDRPKVHFLLAARDTDWKAAKADRLAWFKYCDFSQRPMRGISKQDADVIVSAWAKVGTKGLGRLDGLAHDDAVTRLLEEAYAETDLREGAFFGAMLRTRFGDDLDNHVHVLMTRLAERPAPRGTLLDVMMLVASMHARGIYLLSRAVLAYHLGCDRPTLRRKVIVPLGEEAAATAAGQYVVIRHRAIAEACIRVGEELFDFDSEELLISLGVSASAAGIAGHFVPELGRWRHFASEVYESGEEELAIRLAEAVLKTSPSDPYLQVSLSSLLRRFGDPERAASMFASSSRVIDENRRPYLSEWGMAVGTLGRRAMASVLALCALADDTERRPPDRHQINLSLTGLAFALNDLNNSFASDVFLKGLAGTVKIGMAAEPDHQSKTFYKQYEKSTAVHRNSMRSNLDAIEAIRRAVVQAYEQREGEFPDWLPDVGRMSLQGLLRVAESRVVVK